MIPRLTLLALALMTNMAHANDAEDLGFKYVKVMDLAMEHTEFGKQMKQDSESREARSRSGYISTETVKASRWLVSWTVTQFIPGSCHHAYPEDKYGIARNYGYASLCGKTVSEEHQQVFESSATAQNFINGMIYPAITSKKMEEIHP